MSPRRYQITVRGRQYDVEVGDVSSSPVTVKVNGVDYVVDLPGSGRSGTSAQSAGRPAAPSPSRPATGLPASARPAAPASGGDGIVRALMPGRIVSVSVSVGDSVAAGQAVLVMESMKMENTIAAPAAGKVRSVLVKEGDTVQHGQSLIELE